MDDWMPIESAPKDGTAILAMLPDSDMPAIIHFRGPKANVTWRIAWDYSPLSEFSQPTHWMPLPPLPVDTEKTHDPR